MDRQTQSRQVCDARPRQPDRRANLRGAVARRGDSATPNFMVVAAYGAGKIFAIIAIGFGVPAGAAAMIRKYILRA